MTTKTWVVWSDGWDPREYEEEFPECAALSWANPRPGHIFSSDGLVVHVHLKEGGDYHKYRVRRVISFEVEDEK
jgi:hypothetical protein